MPSTSWPYKQNKANSNYQFHRLSRKSWLFADNFKDWKIIYPCKVFFVTSMNSRSLPQTKSLFGSDQLAKFSFLHENACRQSEHFHQEMRVPFWREGQNELVGTKRFRQTCWRMAILSRESAALPHSYMCRHCCDLVATKLGPGWSTPFECPWLVHVAIWLQRWLIGYESCLAWREQKWGLEGEKVCVCVWESLGNRETRWGWREEEKAINGALPERGEREQRERKHGRRRRARREREREVVLRWRATTASLKYFPNLQNGLSKVHELQNYSVGFLGLNLNHSYFEVNKYLL